MRKKSEIIGKIAELEVEYTEEKALAQLSMHNGSSHEERARYIRRVINALHWALGAGIDPLERPAAEIAEDGNA